MYPSRRQRFRDEDVRVFALDHDIPICESVSPVSSYRWHSMSEAEVDRLPAAADRRGRGAGSTRSRRSTGDRFALAIAHHALHEHGGDARRDPAPRRGRAGHDAAAVLRARHRAEDVRQRAARRQPGRVPAALPAVHAAREDLRLRRSRTTASTWSRRSRPSRSRRCSTSSRSSRATGWCSRHNGYNQHVFRRLPSRPTSTPTGPRCWPGSCTLPPEGSGAARAGGAGRRVRRGGRVLRQVRRLEAPRRPAPRRGHLRAAREADPHPGDRLRAASRRRSRCTTWRPSSGCGGPTSSARGRRTSWRCCSTAPTSAASRPTGSPSAWCSSSAWPAARR